MLSEHDGGRRNGIQRGFHQTVYCTTWHRAGKLYFDAELLMPGEHTAATLVFQNEVPVGELFNNKMLFRQKTLMGSFLYYFLNKGSKNAFQNLNFFCFPEKGCTFTMRESTNRTIGHGIVTALYEPIFIDTFSKKLFNFDKLMNGAKLMADGQQQQQEEETRKTQKEK